MRYNLSVQPTITTRLIDINRQFYQTFALQFTATRQRLQPGVRCLMERLPLSADLLDLGCGSGELARSLARRGQLGSYLGLDFSTAILDEARKAQPQSQAFSSRFLQADLTAEGWDAPLQGYQPDFILAFAVLHHLPGQALRQKVLSKVRGLLKQDSLFIFSVWQFLNSPRLKARLQPWEAAGLTSAQVEPGDYLLDWRQGGRGLRYAHHFSTEELTALAAQSGFEVVETFLSDGEGGKLGLYQTWRPH